MAKKLEKIKKKHIGNTRIIHQIHQINIWSCFRFAMI
jgi:hypothetical protein